ncbi:MAG: hypothetical protein ACREJG_11120 [Candidatus Rokuibacteriota bacterium]
MDDRRHYRSVGGVAAWRVPVLAGIGALVAVGGDEWTVAAVIAVVAAVVSRARVARVLEVGPAGLAQGIALGVGGVRPLKFIGTPRVVAWRAVDEIETAWVRPGDFTALVTVVRGGDAGAIVFDSAMGLGSYRALVADVARCASHARRTGLTDEVLAEGAGGTGWPSLPWSPHRVAVAAGVVMLLALWGLVRLL